MINVIHREENAIDGKIHNNQPYEMVCMLWVDCLVVLVGRCCFQNRCRTWKMIATPMLQHARQLIRVVVMLFGFYSDFSGPPPRLFIMVQKNHRRTPLDLERIRLRSKIVGQRRTTTPAPTMLDRSLACDLFLKKFSEFRRNLRPAPQSITQQPTPRSILDRKQVPHGTKK
jgi:predicted membrane protein